MGGQDRQALVAGIAETLSAYATSDRTLLAEARVGRGTLASMRRGGPIALQSLLNLAAAAEALRKEVERSVGDQERWRLVAKSLVETFGSQAKLAARLGISRPYLTRVIRGERAVTDDLISRLAAVNGEP